MGDSSKLHIKDRAAPWYSPTSAISLNSGRSGSAHGRLGVIFLVLIFGLLGVLGSTILVRKLVALDQAREAEDHEKIPPFLSRIDALVRQVRADSSDESTTAGEVHEPHIFWEEGLTGTSPAGETGAVQDIFGAIDSEYQNANPLWTAQSVVIYTDHREEGMEDSGDGTRWVKRRISASIVDISTGKVTAKYSGSTEVVDVTPSQQIQVRQGSDVDAEFRDWFRGLRHMHLAEPAMPSTKPANLTTPAPLSSGSAADTKSINVGRFILNVPAAWDEFTPEEQNALNTQYQEQQREIYRQYSGHADTAEPVNIVAFHAGRSATFVAAVLHVPVTANLIADLEKQAPDKVKFGIQQGFIRSASAVKPVNRAGFDGFYFDSESTDGTHDFSGGLASLDHKTEIVQLTMLRAGNYADTTRLFESIINSVTTSEP
jgi:hypothetical protein